MRVDLGAMAVKGRSPFPKAPASVEPRYQIVLSMTLVEGGLALLQRCILYILQSQVTIFIFNSVYCPVLFQIIQLSKYTQFRYAKLNCS